MQCAAEGVGSVVGGKVFAYGWECGAVYAEVSGEFGVGGVFGFDECVEVGAVFVGQCIGVPGGVVDPVEVWVCGEDIESFGAGEFEVDAVLDDPIAGLW